MSLVVLVLLFILVVWFAVVAVAMPPGTWILTAAAFKMEPSVRAHCVTAPEADVAVCRSVYRRPAGGAMPGTYKIKYRVHDAAGVWACDAPTRTVVVAPPLPDMNYHDYG